MKEKIKIRGARQHNLKNINLDIPKNNLVVFTGVSGSGKSSLAYDTIYAEGQRRYVESLNTYARQFLGIMEKPDVDLIEGLSPAISIDQKTTSRNPRSTVGTVTEIYDYLRLLFARVGHPHCPICNREISSQSLDQIVDNIMSLIKNESKIKKNVRFLILSPVVRDKKGEFSSLFDNLSAKGYAQIRVDNYIKDLSEDLVLIKTNKHTIEAVCDKISLTLKDLKSKIFQDNLRSRISQSIEQALKLSDGLAVISLVLDSSFEMPDYPKKFEDHLYSEKFSCPVDNVQIAEIEPRTFSFNSPHGACKLCNGIGKILKVDPDLCFAEEISITEGGILPFKNIFEHDTWYSRLVLKACDEKNIDPKSHIKYLSNEQKDVLLNGTGNKTYEVEGTNRFGKITQIYENFTGIVSELERRHKNTQSDWVRIEIEKYMRERMCPDCKGLRLKRESLSITIDKLSISDVTAFSIDEALIWFKSLNEKGSKLSEKEKNIAKLILNEIITRLKFLSSVGINYLTLNRPAGSLSGGEAQRIRLASQIGSGLTGVLYVLDEPTIGLHQKDNQKLIDTLKTLKELGNTVIVVEHDAEMIRQSDFVVDFGPGAGKDGGKIVISSSPKKLIKANKSLTAKYLSGKKDINIRKNNELIKQNGTLKLLGAHQFNLKNIDVEFPLGKLVVITGVSGSGKSSLLVDTLYPALIQNLSKYYRGDVPKYKKIEGIENVDKAILIDQSPIGRTPRSNPATYIKLFDYIRDVYASTRDAKAYGFNKGRFSFNLKGGRCDACEGQGQIKIEMQFMSDIWITCDICKGKRYNSQTLDVHYNGKAIADILEMTVKEAKGVFHAHKLIMNRLDILDAVGLGYIELGQPATTLSGGEAQRIKLSAELVKKDTGNTVYILDEPTTGLHFSDIEKLLNVLRLLVEKGNSVFIIEHNLDVIKNADWVIDLGPEGGDQGGNIIVAGNINKVKKTKNSYTGQYLKKIV